MKPHFTNKNGFSVSDMLIILSIVAIVAASAAPSYFKFVANAKITVAIEALTTTQKYMKDYFAYYGAFPVKVNLSTCTDGNNHPIIPPGACAQLKQNISSFERYTSVANSYILVVRAKDSSRTLLRLTPHGIEKAAP